MTEKEDNLFEFYGTVSSMSGDALEPLLTHDDPMARCLGRLLATNLINTINAFIDAERKRNTSTEIVLAAISKLFTQTFASIIFPYLRPDKRTTFAADYGREVEKEVEKHLGRLEQMMVAGEIERVGRFGVRTVKK